MDPRVKRTPLSTLRLNEISRVEPRSVSQGVCTEQNHDFTSIFSANVIHLVNEIIIIENTPMVGLDAFSLTAFLRENVYKPPIDALKAPGSAPTTKSKQYLHYRSIPASQCASRSLPLPPCSPSLQAPTPPPCPMKLMRRRRSARSKEKCAPHRSSLAARLIPAAGSEEPASDNANEALALVPHTSDRGCSLEEQQALT
ncbi:hypothetical protein LshimejAT787_0700300 [Lyophyllum shimeji]|uniref:Uncharacterized protein n=1 Tax=Lyophyllum shimeji TaxID=47721 RepID=A0A9P3UPX2_LYOSH|nr:hypothetical protein LshimejAT787_0700300 [Lyophyllum shimeji]